MNIGASLLHKSPCCEAAALTYIRLPLCKMSNSMVPVNNCLRELFG